MRTKVSLAQVPKSTNPSPLKFAESRGRAGAGAGASLLLRGNKRPELAPGAAAADLLSPLQRQPGAVVRYQRSLLERDAQSHYDRVLARPVPRFLQPDATRDLSAHGRETVSGSRGCPGYDHEGQADELQGC